MVNDMLNAIMDKGNNSITEVDNKNNRRFESIKSKFKELSKVINDLRKQDDDIEKLVRDLTIKVQKLQDELDSIKNN